MPTYTSAAARISDSATKAGAAYADVQFWMIRTEKMFVRNGDVLEADDDRAAVAATSIARSGSRIAGRIPAVTPTGKTIATWRTPFTRDPESVSLGDRAAHLSGVEKSMHVAPNIVAGLRTRLPEYGREALSY